MSRTLFVVMFVLSLAGVADAALAGGLDGTAPVVCAINDTFDCASGGQCVAASPEAINLPRLIRFDFAAKKLSPRGRAARSAPPQLAFRSRGRESSSLKAHKTTSPGAWPSLRRAGTCLLRSPAAVAAMWWQDCMAMQ